MAKALLWGAIIILRIAVIAVIATPFVIIYVVMKEIGL